MTDLNLSEGVQKFSQAEPFLIDQGLGRAPRSLRCSEKPCFEFRRKITAVIGEGR